MIQHRKANILAVEDDPTIVEFIREALEPRYTVISADSVAEARQKLFAVNPALILLDIGLNDDPNGGFVLLEEIRSHRLFKKRPVLMLTVRNTDRDKVETLVQLAADDYLPKPFSKGELYARVVALLRRAAELPEVNLPEYGLVRMDHVTKTVWVAGQVVEPGLTPREFELLALLVTAQGDLVSDDTLCAEFAGGKYDTQRFNAVRVLVSNVRKRLADVKPEYWGLIERIRTFQKTSEHGVNSGYMLRLTLSKTDKL